MSLTSAIKKIATKREANNTPVEQTDHRPNPQLVSDGSSTSTDDRASLFDEPTLAMLEQLAQGDFSPPQTPINTRAGESLESIRRMLGGAIGKSHILITELNENAASISQNCNNSVAAATKDISQQLDDARETRDRLTAVAAAAEEISVNVSSIAQNAAHSQSGIDNIANTTNTTNTTHQHHQHHQYHQHHQIDRSIVPYLIY